MNKHELFATKAKEIEEMLTSWATELQLLGPGEVIGVRITISPQSPVRVTVKDLTFKRPPRETRHIYSKDALVKSDWDIILSLGWSFDRRTALEELRINKNQPFGDSPAHQVFQQKLIKSSAGINLKFRDKALPYRLHHRQETAWTQMVVLKIR